MWWVDRGHGTSAPRHVRSSRGGDKQTKQYEFHVGGRSDAWRMSSCNVENHNAQSHIRD